MAALSLLLAVLLVAACSSSNPELPPDLDFTSAPVAAGKHHTCVVEPDGMVRCWRAGSGKPELAPPPGMEFEQVSVGLDFACGVSRSGAAVCWGRELQTAPPGGRYTALAAGKDHVCALDSDGAAVCWGELGADPPEGVSFREIGSGFAHSCGLSLDGDLHCWGATGEGQAASRDGPFRGLGVGLHHTCVLRLDGRALCQGRNENGQSTPPGTAFTEIDGGWRHTCGITEAGPLECWGSGVPGAGGVRLDAPSAEFAGLSIGWRNTCGLRPNGDAWCWLQRDAASEASSDLGLTEALEGRPFDQPVELFPWPGGGLAVVERAGIIRAHDPPEAPRLLLDLSDVTECCDGEVGMLGAALDPEFGEFPYLYVYYMTSRNEFEEAALGRLSRFTVVDGVVSSASELTVLEVPARRRAHKGGALRFGPDGMLYLGLGDDCNVLGSSAGAWECAMDAAQGLATLRGKIVRIDVRGASGEQPYRVPDDNPFTEAPGARPEVWAYGLRNPWRMAFDARGRLFAGDVGDGTEEEVSLVTAGANMGWPVFEGRTCIAGPEECEALADAVPPLVSYGREEGCAVIGGTVHPRTGAFLFGDLCLGTVWTLEEDGETGWRMREVAKSSRSIFAFGADAGGAVYVLIPGGPVMRLDASAPPR